MHVYMYVVYCSSLCLGGITVELDEKPGNWMSLNMNNNKHVYTCTCTVYSKTSDSGHFEIGTQYNKPLKKRHSSMSQIIGFL